MPHTPHTPGGTAAPRSPTGSPPHRTSTAKSGMTTAQRKRSYGAMIDRYSLTHSLTHSLSSSLTQSITHSLPRLLTRLL